MKHTHAKDKQERGDSERILKHLDNFIERHIQKSNKDMQKDKML